MPGPGSLRRLMSAMATNIAGEGASRKIFGRRTRDITLPPTGPPDPRLPNVERTGRQIREGIDLLRKKGLMGPRPQEPPRRITGARG